MKVFCLAFGSSPKALIHIRKLYTTCIVHMNHYKCCSDVCHARAKDIGPTNPKPYWVPLDLALNNSDLS